MTSPLSPEREAEIRARAEEFVEEWTWHEATDDTSAGWGVHMGQMLYRLPRDSQTDDMRRSLLRMAEDHTDLLAALDHERAEKARILAAHHAQSRAVEETLGRALGFVEDSEYGLATGDHTPETLAAEIAGRLEKVRLLADDTGSWSAGDARPRLILAMLRGDL